MAIKPLEVGDRVRCKSFLYSGDGTVFYIDHQEFFNHDFSPIQVEMDEPDEHGQTMKRFNLKEVKPL